MNGTTRAKWDRHYAAVTRPPASRPAEVLEANAHLLPPSGRALDLACGLGGNALFLARQGMAVNAWDISAEAIGRLQRQADDEGLPLQTQVRDLTALPPEPARYDVVVVSHFLDRALCPAIAASLKPAGLLFYQTFIAEKVDEQGPSNADFLLGPNELRALFSSLHLLSYREEGRVGDPQQGLRNRAWLVGQRREG